MLAAVVLWGSLGALAQNLGRLVAANSSTPLATLLVVLVGAEKKEKGQVM